MGQSPQACSICYHFYGAARESSISTQRDNFHGLQHSSVHKTYLNYANEEEHQLGGGCVRPVMALDFQILHFGRKFQKTAKKVIGHIQMLQWSTVVLQYSSAKLAEEYNRNFVNRELHPMFLRSQFLSLRPSPFWMPLNVPLMYPIKHTYSWINSRMIKAFTCQHSSWSFANHSYSIIKKLKHWPIVFNNCHVLEIFAQGESNWQSSSDSEANSCYWRSSLPTSVFNPMSKLVRDYGPVERRVELLPQGIIFPSL